MGGINSAANVTLASEADCESGNLNLDCAHVAQVSIYPL